jgi:SAM-dependent methyltransferase
MDDLRECVRLTRISYDLGAGKYHELFRNELDRKPYDRGLLERFARYFTPDSIIHDLGCGPSGHIGHYLHARGPRVIGSDISQRCIDVASTCHPEMEFMLMDMANLALKDRSADGIVSYYSIIHAPKRLIPRFFREFHRVLKRGGKLLLSVKEGDEEGFLEEFLGFRTRIYFAHFHRDDIARFLSDSGFETLFLESRNPLEDEIPVPRIFAIGEKR